MYEDDVEYASKRLNETLVRKLDNSLFFVESTGLDGGKIFHRGINYETGEKELVEHKDLILEPIPLGFVNTSDRMLFVCRRPMRRDWKQGLSSNSLIVYGDRGRGSINFKLLVQPLKKQYPPFKTALSLLDKKDSVAFSRDFGVVGTGGVALVYRKYTVGKVVGGVPILDKDKFFLQQHLEEVTG